MTAETWSINEIRKMEYFAYGKSLTQSRLKYRGYRDPYGYFLSYKLLLEAFSKGLEFHKDGTKDDKLDDLAKEFNYYHLKKGIRTAFYERWAGHSLITINTREKPKTEMEKYLFSAYEPENFNYGYDDDQYLDYAEVTDYIKRSSKIDGQNQEVKRNTLEGDNQIDLDDVFHLITRPSHMVGLGISYLLPIFDTIVTLSTLSESAMYFVVRTGAGLKVVYIPEGKSDDEDYIAKIRAGVERWNAAHSTVILEQPMDNAQLPTKMELLTEQPMDYKKVKDMLLEDIALVTGIPKSRLVGLEPGQLAAGEINQASYFDVLEEIQETYTPLFKWMLERLAHYEGDKWTLPEGTEIVWVKRAALTEMEKADLIDKKSVTFERLLNISELAGMQIEEIASLSGIEYKIDKAMIEEAKAKKEEMAAAFQENGEGDNNDEESDDSEDTEEEE